MSTTATFSRPHGPLLSALLAGVALLPLAATAQNPSADAAAVIEVIQGRRDAGTLTPAQRELLGLALQRWNTPEHCLAAQDAAEELESAANALLRCARQQDFSDDCSREARNVRWAADEYESEVSNVAGECP